MSELSQTSAHIERRHQIWTGKRYCDSECRESQSTAEASANHDDQAQERAEAAWPLTLDQIIKQTLIRVLRETAGNRRRTASLLGISRSTLYRMLARYDIGHVGRDSDLAQARVDPSVRPVPPDQRRSRSPKHSHRRRALSQAVCPGRNGDGFRSTIRT